MESAESGGAAMTTDLVVVFMDIVTDMVEVPLETGEEVRFVRVKPDAFDLTHVVHGKFYSTCRWHTELLAQLIDHGHIVLVKETAVVQNFKELRFWVEIGIRKESVEMVSTTLFRDVNIRVSLRINFKWEYENDVLREVFEKWKTSKQFVMERDKADACVGLSPPADVIKLELHDHQKQGLRWMIDREEWPDSDDGSELPPFWEEKDGLYKADLSFLVTLKHPQMIRGGILADESGMGKTLTLLSLIAYTKHRTNSAAACTSHVKKKQKVEKNVNFEWRPTLVVCPPSILATWKEQIGKCTWPGSLKVSTYHGKIKTRDANLLSQHDIVLTTYNIVVREEESDSGILNKIDWWRVVLDDVHVLKSVNSRATTPFFNLKANRRWAVTGKPLKEDYTNYSLYPSMSFLHVHPYCHKLDWERFEDASPLERTPSPPVPLLRFEVLMGIFSLRRKMPARFIQNYMVVLSKDEQDLYDSLEAKAMKASLEEGSRSSEAALMQLWQSCNSLAPCRLSCEEMISSNNNFHELRRKPKLLKKWLNLLQEDKDYCCPVCLDQPDDAVMTRCAHLFCKSCIMHLIEKYKLRKSLRCPMCRRPLQKCDIFESSVPEKMKIEGSSSANMSSSKVSALITMLRKLTNEKSVVLSQFRRTLELVDGMLSEAGFEVRRMDDAIDNARTKAKIVKEFSNAESRVVLVTSFKALSNTPGLDLSVVSNVYLMEPCWNPHTEEEALSRIHRLGKKEKDVNIIRLVCKKSIEEKVLEIRKMKPAYGSSNSKREVTINDEYSEHLLGIKNITAC